MVSPKVDHPLTSAYTSSLATKRNLLGMPPFLNKEEAAVILAHIERDRGDAQTEQFTFKNMLFHAKDWKLWEFGSYVLMNVSSDDLPTCQGCSNFRRTRHFTLSLSSYP